MRPPPWSWVVWDARVRTDHRSHDPLGTEAHFSLLTNTVSRNFQRSAVVRPGVVLLNTRRGPPRGMSASSSGFITDPNSPGVPASRKRKSQGDRQNHNRSVSRRGPRHRLIGSGMTPLLIRGGGAKQTRRHTPVSRTWLVGNPTS